MGCCSEEEKSKEFCSKDVDKNIECCSKKEGIDKEFYSEEGDKSMGYGSEKEEIDMEYCSAKDKNMDCGSEGDKSMECCSEKEGIDMECGSEEGKSVGRCCEGGERKTVRTDGEKRELVTRINRIVGQMNGVKRMLEEDRYCEDILVQLSAIDKAVRSLSGVMLARHMHTCILDDVREGKTESLDGIVELFKRFQ